MNKYSEYEVQQERYDLSCPVCKGRFYIRMTPPIEIMCPHSKSVLQVYSDGSISVIQAGIQPATTHGGKVIGALGGLLVGALIAGSPGALLGSLAGVALGSIGDIREATYLNDSERSH
jgi:hypothetical protein